MSDSTLYRLVSHLDEPKRYLSLTLDELSIAVLGLMLLVLSSHKLLVCVFALFLFGVLKHLKKGRGPRFLVVLAYWHLPDAVTQMIVPKLPASHKRLWKA